MIRIFFFARLREVLGKNMIELSFDSNVTLAEVRNQIIQQYPEWTFELTQKNIVMSVNKQFAQLETLVEPGDEVAFFPPVTGG